MLSKCPQICKYLFLLALVATIVAPFEFLSAADVVDFATPDPSGYVQLAPLPTPPSGVVTQAGLAGYLQTLFWLAIVLAGVLAVLMITKGGVLYMTSEAFNTKAAAKTQITMAIVGFLLAVSSVLILTTINPDLLKFNLAIKALKPFTIPDLATGTKIGCTNLADSNPLILGCRWTTAITAEGQSAENCRIALNNNEFVNQVESMCAGTKPAKDSFGKGPLCCTIFSRNAGGCSGSGVAEGYTQCAWSKTSTTGDDCQAAGMPTGLVWTVGWTDALIRGSTYTEYPCISPKPGGESMDCCVKKN